MSSFDPDELKLTKEDILRIINSVQKRWRKNGWRNGVYLAGLSAFKQGIKFCPDNVLEVVWRDMMRLTNKMLEYNAMQRMKKEMPDTKLLLDILEKEIESGKFVGDPADW